MIMSDTEDNKDIDTTAHQNLLEKNNGNYFLAAFAVIDRWPVPKAVKSAIKIFAIACVVATVAIMLSWPFWFHKMQY